VLDGGVPPDVARFLALVREVANLSGGDALVHCDSGRGRAPTFAAAVLVARGLARDAAQAVAALRALRSVVAPTRSDVAFLEAAVSELVPAATRAVAVDGAQRVR
jgi:protein-tyrosine phosphatase